MNKLNTLFVGKVLKSFKNLPSTNVYAQNLIAKSKPIEGTVIMALHQTKGRGQRGTTWESEKNNNITLSIIFFPTFLLPQQQFRLNEVISLGLLDFLEKYFHNRVFIKWPNDIYINEKKIAGILIQNSITSTTISSSIVGIGLNVNQKVFSNDIPNPTSMILEGGQRFDLMQLTHELLKKIEMRYLPLRSEKNTSTRQEYIEKLYKLNEVSSFEKKSGTKITGTIKGIDELGRLMIETGNQIEAFAYKEIKFL